jgi:hypothetical protein
MKKASKVGGNAMAFIIEKKVVEGAAGLAHAMKYYRAAQIEEKNGFAFTAAVEWQKAAESLAPFPPLADHCWQQWERIMRLPRRLADPISEVQPATKGANAAMCGTDGQAVYSDREMAIIMARLAGSVVRDSSEAHQHELDLPIIATSQNVAAAAA